MVFAITEFFLIYSPREKGRGEKRGKERGGGRREEGEGERRGKERGGGRREGKSLPTVKKF